MRNVKITFTVYALVLCLLMTFTACGGNNPSDSSSLPSESFSPPQSEAGGPGAPGVVTDESYSVVNGKEYIIWSSGGYTGNAGHIWRLEDATYYVSENGDSILKQDDKTGEMRFYASDIGIIDSIFIDGSWLYFQIAFEPTICRINFENNSFETIFDGNKADLFGLQLIGTWGFRLYNGVLYINDSLACYGYDIGSDELSLQNLDTSSGAFLNNKFYYIEHAQRTFSIYATDLESGETELLRGKGITFEQGDDNLMYGPVAALGEKLLYYERTTNSVYLYSDDGNDVLLRDMSMEDYSTHFCFGTDRQYLYFTQDFPNVIYRYDPVLDKLDVYDGYIDETVPH